PPTFDIYLLSPPIVTRSRQPDSRSPRSCQLVDPSFTTCSVGQVQLRMRVAVIGGGPSGLVQLKVLLSAHKHFPLDEPIEVKLFESYDEIGGVFLHHVYEDAELVSSKFLTSFSDFRPLPEDADFFSSERYREYLNQYATHF